MITERDPTPAELAKSRAAQKRFAYVYLAFGVLYGCIGVFELSKQHYDRGFAFANVGLSICWIVVAWFHIRHASR